MFEANMREAAVDDIIFPMEMLSTEAARQFQDESIDFAYIDADHTYKEVLADIKAWLPKICKNGMIGGHDYADSAGVRQAVAEVFGEQKQTLGVSSWYYIKS